MVPVNRTRSGSTPPKQPHYEKFHDASRTPSYPETRSFLILCKVNSKLGSMKSGSLDLLEALLTERWCLIRARPWRSNSLELH
jgi:hypothetical protein